LITPFYGNFFQAINRLLGYLIIFTTIYCTLYTLQHFGIAPIAEWISLGYLPAFLYGFIEALVAFNISWAITVVQAVRQYLIVDMPWTRHLSLFTTEPSFVSFQVILLLAILPFVKNRWLQRSNIAIILLAFVFTLSGHVVLQILVYLVMLVFFKFRRSIQLRLAAATALLGGMAAVAYIFLKPIQATAQFISSRLMQITRFQEMTLSAAIRASYIKNLIYTLIETRGLGLGIGQYGQFWREIYLQHINYKPLGIEVINALNSSEYMRPWSVILGIGADLGVVGLLLMMGFLYEVWRYLRNATAYSAHGQAIWVSSVIALAGAYPIVTPHVWIALALLAGLACQQQAQSREILEQANLEKLCP